MAKKKKSYTKKTVQPAVKKVKVIRQNQISFLKNHWIPIILFFILGLGLYLPTLNYEYVLDDKIVLSENNYVKKGFKGIKEIFTTESFQGYFGQQRNLVQGSRYRPLSIATFAIEHQFFGLNKRVSHFINALLYGLLCMLIYRVLVMLFNDRASTKWYYSIPFIATFLYALHPVHIEAVANIKGRDEIMSMLLAMKTWYFCLLAYDKKKWLYLFPAAVAFFLAILAKENAITFLAIIPFGYYFFRKMKWQRVGIISAVLAVVIAIYLAVRIEVIGFLFDKNVQVTDIMNDPFFGMKGDEKWATIVYTLGQYLKLSFIPIELTHDYYPYHIPKMNWSKMGSIISLLIYIGIAGLGIWGIIKKKKWTFSILFFGASLSIISNIFFSVGTFMNERFLFMPSLGICIFLAFLLAKWLPEWLGTKGKMLGLGLAVLIGALFLVKDIFRIPAWKDTMSLNRAAVTVSTNSARANLFYGTALFEQYKVEKDAAKRKALLDESEIYFEKSLQIYPTYGYGVKMKSGVYAERYKVDRDLNKLLAGFKSLLQIRPVEFIDTYMEYLNNRADANTLVAFYLDIAVNVFARSASQNPDRNLRSRLYAYAIKYLNYGLQLQPGNTQLQTQMNQMRALQNQ